MTLYYLEAGEEALYAPFNKDYLNYTVKQGYKEDFPFGQISHQSGAVFSAGYSVLENLNVNAKAGYWLSNSRLKNDFNFSVSIYYNLNISDFY